MDDNNSMKTGTTTVGIKCNEGIVLAADMRATAGNLIVTRKAEKIHEISDNMAVTIAGTVSDAQLLIKLIKAEIALKRIRTGMLPGVKETSNLLAGMIYSNIRKFSVIPGVAHFILGGVDDTGLYIYDLFPDGSITLCDEYISSGSGCVMAYGVLDTLYNKDMSLDDAKKLAIKAINAALQRDTATGNGLTLFVISKDGVNKIMEKEIDVTIKEE